MKNKKYLKIVLAILTTILVLSLGIFMYASDYYHATTEALAQTHSSQTVTVTTPSDDLMIFEPEHAKAGFIFYPGGKVEYTAYAPLLHELAEEGILCALVKMPLNLAVLDINAADGIQALYPEIQNWYIGGHSLGGSMAASYLAKHQDKYNGLVLLGAYSTSDLSDTDLDVISIYGSNDQVLNTEKYETYKDNLPTDFTEFIIDGGSHAYFGTYGLQEGDGIATISNEEQIDITADLLLEHMAS